MEGLASRHCDRIGQCQASLPSPLAGPIHLVDHRNSIRRHGGDVRLEETAHAVDRALLQLLRLLPREHRDLGVGRQRGDIDRGLQRMRWHVIRALNHPPFAASQSPRQALCPTSLIQRPISEPISPGARRCIVIAKQPAVKRYIVTLSADERERLNTLIQKGTSPARQVPKARILLKADTSEAGEAWSDGEIAEALDGHQHRHHRPHAPEVGGRRPRCCPDPSDNSAAFFGLAIVVWSNRPGLGPAAGSDRSVGVGRQYCGQLGKQDNCQVGEFIGGQPSEEPARRLPGVSTKGLGRRYLRRAIIGVPDDIRFQTKPEIALQQVRHAVADGVPPGAALMDPAYGNDSKLRTGISELGLSYVAGILPTTMVWRPGEAPLSPPAPRSGRGRPGTRRDETHRPVSAKTLALELAAAAWQQIKWRDGSNTALSSRFARWRVRPPHDDARRSEPAAEEWLLIAWPEGEAEPDHYWLSTLPADISLESMADQAKLRWRIERDYLELKQEVGLGHFEGRGWRGFHHHATLCVAAYGFLISEKETIPPSGPARARRRSQSTLPAGYQPRPRPALRTASTLSVPVPKMCRSYCRSHLRAERVGAGSPAGV